MRDTTEYSHPISVGHVDDVEAVIRSDGPRYGYFAEKHEGTATETAESERHRRRYGERRDGRQRRFGERWCW